MNWVPIAKKLPPDNEEVWCYDTEYREVIGYHNRYGWFHVYGDNDGLGDDKLYGITHWQPLPRPPEPLRSEQYTKPGPSLLVAILSSLPGALQGKKGGKGKPECKQPVGYNPPPDDIKRPEKPTPAPPAKLYDKNGRKLRNG